MSEPSDSQRTTHFGYQEVPVGEKAHRVGAVFDSVAPRYDIMNDLMSAGLHRLWKRQALAQARLRPGLRVLDLAAGTGDLAMAASRAVGDHGLVVATDINAAMLGRGRDRITDAGIVNNVVYTLADAEALPFPDGSFDRITMAFGLRNVTDKARALAAIRRVLRPGGVAVILEFSQLYLAPLRPVYDAYSLHVLPRLGRWVAGDSASYRYLAESIRQHPDQETLKTMMLAAGFDDADYTNTSGGIVAIHRGQVY
jgi:demethylmenaquinone methyltransferase/2-methoxy-6-polyprenyl-1,4-benzoquinol methylase